MEFEMGYMTALVIIGISFLGFFLSMMISEINKKKGIVFFIMSLILFGLGVYYYYLVGQYQKAEGIESYNKLNEYIGVYKYQPPSIIPSQLPPFPSE